MRRLSKFSKIPREDVFHNDFNYHGKYPVKLIKQRTLLIDKFTKTFRCLDWSGKIYDGSGMMVNIDFPVPWTPIIEKLYEGMLPFKDKIIIEQVKEKFGSIRCYYITEGCSKEERTTIDSVISFCEGMVEGFYLADEMCDGNVRFEKLIE